MRGTRAKLLAVLAGGGALAAGSPGVNANVACASHIGSRGVRLPAPITIAAGHDHGSVSYRIECSGRVLDIPKISSPFPRDSAWFPGAGVWYAIRHGHLVVGRGTVGRASRSLWRSRGEFPQSQRNAWQQIGVVRLGSHSVGFTYDNEFYVAPLGGAERQIARSEFPLGWTSGGLYTYRDRGRELLLRTNSGTRVRKVIAKQTLGGDYFLTNGVLYFIAHGVVWSAHGTQLRRLTSLSNLGMTKPYLQPAGRMLELEDNHRLVVLRQDGSLFAWVPLSEWRAGGISSPLVPAPDANSVAFTATVGQGEGTETVYLLRAGAHTAAPVHTEAVTFKVCERGATVQWHGSWLLYTNSEGSLSAIDTTGAHRAIELGSLVRRLPGTRDGFNAYWSGQPPRL